MIYRDVKLLTAEEVASVRAPIETALTLPNRAYVSADFYAAEVENIYMKRWVAACFECDLPNDGDAYPFFLCGVPLVALNTSGAIRVFHNVCPYDGCPFLLEPSTGLRALVSPYHGWTYDFDGRLVGAPYWDGNKNADLKAIRRHAVDLAPVECATFMGTVFVKLGGNAQSLDAYVEPIKRRFSEYDLDCVVVGSNASGAPLITPCERRTNWKTFFENSAINILHENFVHDLYAVSPEIPRIKSDGVPAFTALRDRELFALVFDQEDVQNTYPDLGLPHIGRNGAPPTTECFGTHYPNFYFSFAPTHIEIAYALPDGPDHVSVRQTILYHKEVAKSASALKMRRLLSGAFDGASIEDGRIVEAVHAARRSPAFGQKFYSPFWDTLHYEFNKLIIEDLGC